MWSNAIESLNLVWNVPSQVFVPEEVQILFWGSSGDEPFAIRGSSKHKHYYDDEQQHHLQPSPHPHTTRNHGLSYRTHATESTY